MSEPTFYRCNTCGNLVYVVNEGTCTPECCGEPMEELVAGSTDAAAEKHVPVIERSGETVTVKVGEIAHPMLEAHFIQWIALAYGEAVSFHYLEPGEEPVATFAGVPADAKVVAFEHCNLHGLWKAGA